jgi:hypothetical protein
MMELLLGLIDQKAVRWRQRYAAKALLGKVITFLPEDESSRYLIRLREEI